MSEAKSKSAWLHTASLMALVANICRDDSQHPKPFTVSDFDPTNNQAPAEKQNIDVGILKSLFIDN